VWSAPVPAPQFEAPRFFLTALDDYRRNPETAEAVLGYPPPPIPYCSGFNPHRPPAPQRRIPPRRARDASSATRAARTRQWRDRRARRRLTGLAHRSIGVHTELVESKDLALTRGDFYEGGVLSKVNPRAFARTALFSRGCSP
jgi:hypothetical protein